MLTSLLMCVAAAGLPDEVSIDRPAPKLLAGIQFRKALEQPFSATWSRVTLRRVIRRIGERGEVAVLLDRRIDPTQPLELSVNGETLRDIFDRIGRSADGRTSAVGSTVYVGPAAAASKLRTLVHLRSDELVKASTRWGGKRHLALSRRRMLHWSDLESPVELLQRIAKRYDLEIRELDSVPHDLWAGATLSSVNAAEALSLVLIQFDLTFAWGHEGNVIRLLPVPERVQLERRYRSRGQSAAQAAAAWRERIVGIDTELRGGYVVVRGTLEQHEVVTALLRPSGRRTAAAPKRKLRELKRRMFTLSLDGDPVRAVMKKLEESDVKFQYDARALEAAGVDLDQPIRLDLKDAGADAFFHAVFDPLGLQFEIDGYTVRLSPK
ncbi:MAG: hypothetical protein CMJ48_13400 [Planctomycetaceae bacterium]|nr:hypothetical protein [Planctomycetaceae bacterium]